MIAGNALKEEAIPRKTVKTRAKPEANIAGYFAAAWATAASTLAAELMKPHLGGETVPLIFTMGVLGVAYLFGLGPSVLAAVASMLCYNFFFIPPVYSFTIADPINAAALFFFLFTALIVSNLTARVRRQAESAHNRAAITSALYGFSRNLASQAKLDDLLSTSVSQIASSLGVMGHHAARRPKELKASRPFRPAAPSEKRSRSGAMVLRALPVGRPRGGHLAGSAAPVSSASDEPRRHRRGGSRGRPAK